MEMKEELRERYRKLALKLADFKNIDFGRLISTAFPDIQF